MGHVLLGDALALVMLYATTGSPKRAGGSALTREAHTGMPEDDHGELQLAAGALGRLSERPKTAARILLELTM